MAKAKAPIEYRLNERKATAAAVLLLELDGGTMDYMRLVKLMYFAEREALKTYGRPITGDLYFSMEDGPVLSTVLDFCKTRQAQSRIWDEAIKKVSRWTVGLNRPFSERDLGPLSDAEIEILKRISERHKEDDQWVLSKIAHRDFKEWKEPGPGSRLPIQPDEIMAAVGKTPSQIEEIREEARYDANLDKAFGVF
jgi:uncharacterized phage-associated protein